MKSRAQMIISYEKEKRGKAEKAVFSQPALCSICQGNGTHAKTQSSCEIHAKMRLCALLFWPWFWHRASGRCEPGAAHIKVAPIECHWTRWRKQLWVPRVKQFSLGCFWSWGGIRNSEERAGCCCCWKTRNSFSIYLGRQKSRRLLTYFAPRSKTLIHSFHSRIVLIELSAWWKGAPARARASLFATCILSSCHASQAGSFCTNLNCILSGTYIEFCAEWAYTHHRKIPLLLIASTFSAFLSQQRPHTTARTPPWTINANCKRLWIAFCIVFANFISSTVLISFRSRSLKTKLWKI